MNRVRPDCGMVRQIACGIVSGERPIGGEIAAGVHVRNRGSAAANIPSATSEMATAAMETAYARTAEMTASDVTAATNKMPAAAVTASKVPTTTVAATSAMTPTASTSSTRHDRARQRNRKNNHRQPFEL
jgi:hypothetical protein